MKTILGAMFSLSLLVAGTALAEDAAAKKPAPDAVKAVWDFYKSKGAGVILADARACTEVGKEGDTKFECTKEIGPEGVKAGTNVLIWQAYLVPQGDSVEDITIQVKQGETLRETKDVTVKGESMRTRTWTGVHLPKPGDWTIVVARGSETLKTITVKATK